MTSPHRFFSFGVLLLTATAALNAQSEHARDELTGTIRIVGTDTMKDLMGRWIAGFTALHPGVRIDLTAKGALTAAPALANGSADLAPLGREFTPAEIAAFRTHHPYDPTAIPVALGSYDISGKTVALAFFVNQANPIEHLSFQQLDAIYCTSLLREAPRPITTWGQLGLTGEWAGRPIDPVGVNFPDGISNYIRLRICKDGLFRPDIHQEHTGGPINVLDRIVTDIAADPVAIGYAGFANLKPGSKLIPISEDSGPYLTGTRAEVEAARYPLTRTIYLFVDRPPGQPIPQPQRAFLKYITSPQGQALIAADKIYMPLPRSVTAAQQLQLASAQEESIHAETLKSPADPALPRFMPGPQIAARLTSFGTDTMDTIMKFWIAGFHEQQPRIAVELQSKASLSVPAALTAGTAQLAPMSRELNPFEIEAFRAKHGYAPTEIAVALGSYRTPTRTVALTFYVNDANPLTKLSLDQLDAIWCTTLLRGAKHTITEWGQLGLTGEWTHRPIHLVGVLPPDGVPNFISRRICSGGTLREGIYGEKNGEPTSVLTRIVQDVAKDPDAIGYAGFHNRQPNTHPISLAVTSSGPFYTGSFDEVRTAIYPLTRYIYIDIDHAPGQPLAPAMQQFLDYVLSFEGQHKVEEEGIFMPLPPQLAQQQRNKLK